MHVAFYFPRFTSTLDVQRYDPNISVSDILIELMIMLQGVFPLGTLNPALYKRASSEERAEEGGELGHWGRLSLALSYLAPEERLHITLRRASGLPAAPSTGDATDPCLPIAR